VIHYLHAGRWTPLALGEYKKYFFFYKFIQKKTKGPITVRQILNVVFALSLTKRKKRHRGKPNNGFVASGRVATCQDDKILY
jgi:hypothetical protein